MKRILSEKNLVVLLFIMVLITFSLAQEDSKKLERNYSNAASITAYSFLKSQVTINHTETKTLPSVNQ